MNTFSNPIKKNNFEASELKIKNKKAQKSERRGSKQMINKMIQEDQEIKEAINIQGFEEDVYFGIDWGFDDVEYDYNN